MYPHLSRTPSAARGRTRSFRAAVAGLAIALTGIGLVVTNPASSAAEEVEFFVNEADLEFILNQIDIAEAHAAGGELLCADPADTTWTCVPDKRLPYGLRTVDGSMNNLFTGRKNYGASGQTFPRLLPGKFEAAGPAPFDPDGPGPVQAGDQTTYQQKRGLVFDAEPRQISNLIVDQTAGNPAAVSVLGEIEGSYAEDHDGDPATPDRIFIPNVSPDEGLSAPFNSWFTLFGQFFDHGLDLVDKGGSGTVMVPLQPDDPLYGKGAADFLVLTRSTNRPGPDGVLGTTDDVQEHRNRTTPFVDQNQTYTSQPAHQVFIREYEATPTGPVPTGALLEGADGGLATWADIKAQARTVLGIELDDLDVLNVPMVAADPYGGFLPGDNGLPQLVVSGGGEPTLVEGSLSTPVDATTALRVNVSFLDDIAHGADPTVAGYDAALLDSHFITGDGRGNENIGLTSVHHVFHSEHNRLTQQIDELIGTLDPAVQAEWRDESGPWGYGERLFQASRFVTEMEYQHMVFEEFARFLAPSIDVGPLNETLYHADIDPAITAEFAHVVYRFGHSMLTDTIARDGFETEDISLVEGFLNPAAFTDNGRLTADQGAGAVIQGMANQVGSGIDEFVVDSLRNELLGLPLDLATINLTRAREAGIPRLQEARRIFYQADLNPALKPYDSWEDFRLALKHRASITNFVAAYGNHPSIAAATTVDGKRAAAAALVADPAFMNRPAAESGLNDVDFWIGGLAERPMVFGGMLGSTFNVVFEEQLENLQNADRFYYLTRLQGMNLIHQMEANSFAEIVARNTGATNLPANMFASQSPVIRLADLPADSSQWPAGLSQTPDGTFRYDGGAHVAMHGTAADDRMRGGDGDDALWGYEGRDQIEGDVGNDTLHGGSGDDVLTDLFGDDVIHAGAGHDAVNAGPGLDLLFGQSGSDFVLHGQEPTQSFAGAGTDFVRGGRANDVLTGNEEDDWLEGGIGHDLVQGDNALTFQNDPRGGADVLYGGSGNDDHDAEGGNDVALNNGIDRHAGMLGFDWVTHKSDPDPVDADLGLTIFQPPNVQLMRSRYLNVEGVSGWTGPDVLRGRSVAGDPATPAGEGHQLTQEHLDQVVGLRALLGGGQQPPYAAPFMAPAGETEADAPDILLGGAESDILEGRAGDDFIDGDAWLDAYLVGPGDEVGSSMAAFQERIFAGTLSPADLSIVREIRTPSGQAAVVDTAVYSGDRAEYTVTENGDGTVTVSHEDGDGTDGTDTLRNVERLLFADGEVDLTEMVHAPAEGTVAISDLTPTEDQELTVTVDVADPNGLADPPAFSYTWQSQADDGSWIATPEGIEETFTPGDAEVGRALRVVVTFVDGLGTQEQVISEPTDPVANVNDAPVGPVVDDTSPVIGATLTASGLEDSDGLPADTGISYRWQSSQGGGYVDIPGATGPSYTVRQADGARTLRVVATYTDLHGTAEAATSAATEPVPAWTVPAAPTAGAASAGVDSATFQWTAPADTGGAPLTSYSVEVRAGGQLLTTLTGLTPEETSVTVPLTDGTYRFRVAASNAVGQSPWSALSDPVTIAPLDLTAPVVEVRQPDAGATGVARGVNVGVTFSEPVVGVDASTLVLRRVSDGVGVPGTVTMVNDRRAVLDPTAFLDSQAEYEVALAGSIADTAGNVLTPVTWRFTTVDATRPTVVSGTPAAGATGVDRNVIVRAVFDEPVQGVGAASVQLLRAGTPVAATVGYDPATRTASLDPNAVLFASTTYTVRLTTAVTDLAGNTLPVTQWQFTTGTAITPNADQVAPTVASRTTGTVGRTQVLTVRLSERVVNFRASSVRLMTTDGRRLPVKVKWIAKKRLVKVTPTRALPAGERIVVTIKAGLRDEAGNRMRAQSWRVQARG